MNPFEMALAFVFPAMGGIGVWVTWNLARDWLSDRRRDRRVDQLDRLSAVGPAELPHNPRLSAEIERLREAQAALETVERPAALGDFTVIDFVGTLDGEPFEGGEARGHLLELGSNQLIEGFEEQLVGASAGDEREVRVTFPEDYRAEPLAAVLLSDRDARPAELAELPPQRVVAPPVVRTASDEGPGLRAEARPGSALNWQSTWNGLLNKMRDMRGGFGAK